MIPAVDLFSGAGGFSAGAELAGARVLLAANHNPDAVRWHQRNHPATEHACQDLQQFDFSQLPDISRGLLLAAPACQGHSQNAQPARKGTGGSHAPDLGRAAERAHLQRSTAWAVVTAAEVARPRGLIVENVPDFLRWRLFPAWGGALVALGYTVRTHVLNAARYGSAQDRQRLIVTADRDGRGLGLSPTWGADSRALGDCLDLEPSPEHRWAKGGIAAKSERMRWRMRKAQKEAGSLCVWNNVSESRGRAMHERAPTLTTKSGSQLYLLDGDDCRILNPRELARIQGLPDTFQLPKQRALCSLLIGNMIPVELSRGVTAQVLGQL